MEILSIPCHYLNSKVSDSCIQQLCKRYIFSLSLSYKSWISPTYAVLILFDAEFEPRGRFADYIGCFWKEHIFLAPTSYLVSQTREQLTYLNQSILIINFKIIINFTQFDALTRFSLRIYCIHLFLVNQALSYINLQIELPDILFSMNS